MTDNFNTDIVLQGAVVDAILQKMGGLRPTAQKLNLSVSTVQGWKYRKMIPKSRVDSIDTYFKQHFNISVADFYIQTKSFNNPLQNPDTSLIPKTKGDKKTESGQKPVGTPLKNAISKNHGQKVSVKLLVSTVILSILTPIFAVLVSQSPMGKNVINRLYGYKDSDSVVNKIPASDVKNVVQPLLSPLQSQIQNVQSDMTNIVKMQNTIFDIQATQWDMITDISKLKNRVQNMQDISDNMSTLYQQMTTMTQNMQTDITQIKQSVVIKNVYQIQWRILYMFITSGQPYAHILSTITIPKTADNKGYWDTVYTHKDGLITYQQMRTILYENAFLIAPALANISVKEDSSIVDRVRAKLTHLVFVTATPDGTNISQNSDLDMLFDAINNNDTAYIVQALEPLNIPQLQPVLHRLEQRYQVLNAMHSIWDSLQNTPNQNTSREKNK